MLDIIDIALSVAQVIISVAIVVVVAKGIKKK